MRTVRYFLLRVVCIAALAGCHQAAEIQHTEQPSSQVVEMPSTDSSIESVTRPPIDSAHDWYPRYIPTGASSGIMIEFTGLKKDRILNAHYAFIQVWPDSVVNDSAGAQTLLSRINDLHQAFFPLTPGNYRVRQMKEWAERSLYHNIVVREGHYSIIPLDVAGPWKQKLKEAYR